MMSHTYALPPTAIMSGIQTVHERGQGAYQFSSYYESLCALQSSVPLTSVKSNLDKNILQINCDKIRLSDWPPILKALRINKSLEKVAIHSYYEATPEPLHCSANGTPTRRPSYTPSKQKVPPVHSKDMTYQLCKAIKDCLAVSENLKCLELEGLPFRSRDIILLSKGVSLSCSLRSLSLECSHVGDSITVLCEQFKNASTVNSLNLSGCGLADGAVEAISKIIKHQAIMRHSEAWKSSLRYRAPDLDCMPGLRRITLNKNPLLGDGGAKALSDSLKDDLWLKAVDLQECGLTDAGAEYLLDALRLNSTVLVLDIRGNHMVNRALVERIIQQVMINSDGKTTQFSWLPVESERKKETYSSRHSSMTKSGTGMKPPSRSKTMVASPSRKRSAPQAESVSPLTPRSVSKQRGLPWRTAERANAHKFVSEPDLRAAVSSQKVHVHRGDTSGVHRGDTSGVHRGDASGSVSSSDGSSIYDGGNSITPYRDGKSKPDHETLTLMKELQAENISLKRRLKEESTARLAAEDRALELARENRRLQSQLRRASFSTGADGAADEELLTQVEAAFSMFNQFLDLVRDTGLEHLIHEAGLDTFAGTSSPIPSPLRVQSGQNSTNAQDYSDYVMKRQIALQSDDIIRPTASTDSPKKTYTEIMTDGNVLALAASIRSAEQAETLADSPAKAKKKRKSKPKDDKSEVRGDGVTAVPDVPDITSGTYKIKAFELKDVSELETPKLTPRLAPTADVLQSTEGFPDLPEDMSEHDSSPPTESSARAVRKQALAEVASSRDTATVTTHDAHVSESLSEKMDEYSSNDFASVTVSKDSSSTGNNSHREVIHLSDPEVSLISYTSSADDQGRSELNNIKSLSELGSSVEDITSAKD